MSTSIAILKVLSAYPEGRAVFPALKADLALLNSSREWQSRIRALAAACDPVNLFTDGLAIRDASGWTITPAGRSFLDALEDGLLPLRSAKRPELRVVGTMTTGDGDRAEPRLSQAKPVQKRAAG